MKNNIRFYSKDLYPQKVIETAIEDYKNISKIIVSSNKNGFVCCFSDCLVDETRVVAEFDNYLIELINKWGINE
jgi:hypothetical protein